jgi:Bacterial toxin of type II toxin-antitoxin system, YafQ
MDQAEPKMPSRRHCAGPPCPRRIEAQQADYQHGDAPVKGFRDGPPDLGCVSQAHLCQIEPDWLLLYKIDGNDLILARTGTYADLFS